MNSTSSPIRSSRCQRQRGVQCAQNIRQTEVKCDELQEGKEEDRWPKGWHTQ